MFVDGTIPWGARPKPSYRWIQTHFRVPAVSEKAGSNRLLTCRSILIVCQLWLRALKDRFMVNKASQMLIKAYPGKRVAPKAEAIPNRG